MLTCQPIYACALKPSAFEGIGIPYEKRLCDVGVIVVIPRDKRNR